MTRKEWLNEYMKVMGDMVLSDDTADSSRLARIEQTEIFCVSAIEQQTDRLRKLKRLKQAYKEIQ